MIAAVGMVRDEADVIHASISNLLNQGVEKVFVADHQSSDGTRDILEEFRRTGSVDWVRNHDPVYRQPRWINKLAGKAALEGAEWIIPFDADEFWYGLHGQTISEALGNLSLIVRKVRARSWLQLDQDRKFAEPQDIEIGKVAYRWHPRAWVHWGNHDVISTGRERDDVLELRHWAYRNFEQFCRKVQGGLARLDPDAREIGACYHWSCYENFTEQQMREAWERYVKSETIYDPIPS